MNERLNCSDKPRTLGSSCDRCHTNVELFHKLEIKECMWWMDGYRSKTKPPSNRLEMIPQRQTTYRFHGSPQIPQLYTTGWHRKDFYTVPVLPDSIRSFLSGFYDVYNLGWCVSNKLKKQCCLCYKQWRLIFEYLIFSDQRLSFYHNSVISRFTLGSIASLITISSQCEATLQATMAGLNQNNTSER